MDWVSSIHQAIQYIEEHLREELTIREIAQQAALAPFYFQKGFAMLCGMTVVDYIRQRRLSVAGLEILTSRITSTAQPMPQRIGSMTYSRICPLPLTRYFTVVSSCSPIGPLA